MKLLLTLTLLLSFGCATHSMKVATVPTQPTQKTATEKVLDSITRLSGTGVFIDENGDMLNIRWVCTAFSIAPRKFLTAAHCVTPLHAAQKGQILLDEKKAFVIAMDEVNDLAIIVADIPEPSLIIRTTPLSKFEHVNAVGYGHAYRSPLVTEHTVLILKYSPVEGVPKGTIFLYPFIGGMSGGPVYDGNGEIVGMVQRSSEFIGYGVTSDTILDFLVKN